ncbi:MAG: type II secretion system protein [Phycisphaerae bacterium]
MAQNRPARAHGFTLVELLVVIGIIALLISILLPSLSKAREAANTVACLSNQRQIGQATIIFADEHGQWLPTHYDNSGPTSSGSPPVRNTSWGYTYPLYSWSYVLSQAINGGKEAFRCPSDGADNAWGAWTDASWVTPPEAAEDDDIPASYRWNMSHFPDGGNGVKLTQFKNASQSMILTGGFSQSEYPESFLATWDTNAQAQVGELTPTNAAYNRHGGESVRDGEGNYLFLDGHAETMLWNATWKQLGETNAGEPLTMWRQLYLGSYYNGGLPLGNVSP